MTITIDIVVPSFNLSEKFLKRLLGLEMPSETRVSYYVVNDNPDRPVPAGQVEDFKDQSVTIITNAENLGAHASRNIGIDAGSGDWILFIDDDVTPSNDLLTQYVNLIQKFGDGVPGFVGATDFPPVVNRFTQAIKDSDILTFFDWVDWHDWVHWGVTANMIIRRSALGDLRFSDKFPKAGGGEDIDLCLNICKGGDSLFASAPAARVEHEWWGSGRTSFTRFGRWAFGDSRLPPLHPEFRYYNFPNVAETTFFLIFLTLIALLSGYGSLYLLLLIPLAIIVAEIIAEFIKLGLTKRWSIASCIYSTGIRGINDTGRLIGNLSRFRFHGILERFDYFCTGESIPFERKVAFMKTMMYLIAILMIVQSS